MTRKFRLSAGLTAMVVALPLGVSMGTASAAPLESEVVPAGEVQVALESRVKDIIEVDGLKFRDLNDNGSLDVYEDWRKPTEERAADLVAQMTNDEKAGMMLISSHFMGNTGRCENGFSGSSAPNGQPADTLCESAVHSDTNMFGGEKYPDEDGDGLPDPVWDSTGATEGIIDNGQRYFIIRDNPSAEDLALWANALQEVADSSRLGIPVVMTSNPRNHINDNLAFGFQEASGQFSSWPGELGLAATNDPALVKEFAQIAAKEWRAAGIQKGYMYMADVATEPRWTRVNGTFGESPELASDMITAIVEGFQGESLTKDSVSQTTKHFPGGGPRVNGHDPHYKWGSDNYYTTPGSLFEYHLPAFQAAVDAGTTSIMPYYAKPVNTSADQLPKELWYSETEQFEEVGFAFNEGILQGLLRDHMGFEGYVNTDTGVTSGMIWGVEDLTRQERFVKGIEAGTNIFSGDANPTYIRAAIADAEDAGDDDFLAKVDRSVTFLANEIISLGLLEDPYTDPEHAQAVAEDPASQAKADEAQRKSIVLLRNGADDAPALPITDTEGIKLYVEVFARGDTTARTEGLAERIAEYDPSIEIVTDPAEATHQFLWVRPSIGPDLEDSLMTVELSAAEAETTGIDVDRIQELQAMDSTSILAVNFTNPWVIEHIEPGADAVLATFNVSVDALVDVIRGDHNPGGKMPFTVPANNQAVLDNASDVPGYAEKNPNYAYVDGNGDTYEFGYGQSYDDATHAPATAAAAPAAPVGQTANVWGNVDGPATVSTQVKLPNGSWSTSQTRTNVDGFYAIPLTYGAGTVGTYDWRVVVTYADGSQEVLDEFQQERVQRTSVNASAVAPVGRTANVWGTVVGAAKVSTQVQLADGSWSTSQFRDVDGGYVVPLTYGQNAKGTYTWRLVIQHESGMVEVSEAFTQRRAAAPTANSAGSAAVNTTANVWGTVDVTAPTKVWTEVFVAGKGWPTSQQTTTNANGGYVLPLTYGHNSGGTYQFRVAAEYPGVGVVYSADFVFVRTGR